jgi:hypothetical protein
MMAVPAPRFMRELRSDSKEAERPFSLIRSPAIAQKSDDAEGIRAG